MLFSIILWGLVIVVGVPLLLTALSLYSYRMSLADIEAFRHAELNILPLEQMRDVPRHRLQRFAEALKGIGFTELLGYTKAALAKKGNTNYCWVFVAPDGKTLGEAEYVRINWFERVFFFLFGGRRYVSALCGITLVSAFEGNRRIITTDLEQIEETAEPGKREVCIVPKGTPLNEAYERHCAARDKFQEKDQLKLKAFHDQEDFVEFEKNYRRYLTMKAERELEDAWDDSFDGSDV